MIAPDPSSSAAPTPNTSRRMDHSRPKDSSSPMENKSRMMPNSAIGSTASTSEMVTAASHGAAATWEPRPNGPTATPIRMKPMIGLTPSRANNGMTRPVAPRMTSASDRPRAGAAWTIALTLGTMDGQGNGGAQRWVNRASTSPLLSFRMASTRRRP